jgi:ABC-2 type transport system ATP-binding protein
MGEPALEVNGLTRRYGKRAAIDDLRLRVEPGDVYGLLGPNGAGKTTAMRCILGLIVRDAGDVKIFGESDPFAARRHLGAIIEVPAFHEWLSGRQNLWQAALLAGLPEAEIDAEIRRVLERVGLQERADDRAGTYSLGMKQRLGIARALLGRPKLLLLDEPTNGLDPAGMREMRDLIRSLALHDGITVLVSSHLLAEVQAICNRVGIIQAGKMRAEGRVDELIGEHAQEAVVEIGSPDAEKLRVAIEAMDGVEILGPGERGRLRVRHPGLALSALNAALVRADVPVEALVPARRSLEDVFMEVTR